MTVHEPNAHGWLLTCSTGPVSDLRKEGFGRRGKSSCLPKSVREYQEMAGGVAGQGGGRWGELTLGVGEKTSWDMPPHPRLSPPPAVAPA